MSNTTPPTIIRPQLAQPSTTPRKAADHAAFEEWVLPKAKDASAAPLAAEPVATRPLPPPRVPTKEAAIQQRAAFDQRPERPGSRLNIVV